MSLRWSKRALCFEDLDLHSIQMHRHANSSGGCQRVGRRAADLRAARRKSSVCATRSTGSRESRSTAIKPTRRTRPQGPPRNRNGALPKAWSKGRKTERIPIDRSKWWPLIPLTCRRDACFKGYEDVVVRMSSRTDNVLFGRRNFTPVQHTTTWLLAAGLPWPIRRPRDQKPDPGVLLWSQMSEPKVASCCGV